MKRVIKKRSFIGVLILLTITLVWAKRDTSYDRLVGTILKAHLERFHYRKMSINDDLSQKAFGEYLKRTDFSKLFLLKSDVDKLKKFQFKLDDQLESGDLALVDMTMKIMKTRVSKIESLRQDLFQKGFDFNKKESLEVDPDKRDFAKDEKEFEDLWRKTFKQQVLSRYLSYLDEKEDYFKNDKKEENKEKKHKELKKDEKPIHEMSDKELIKKAHDAISKKYDRYFTRLNKDNWSDFTDKFYNSIAAVFDPHTTYLPPKKKEDFDIDISGSLEGIGATLQEDEGYIKVVDIIPGGAAWRQKELEVEDLIVAVAQGPEEPVDLVEMRVDDAVRYIRGPKGTEVRLTVKKPDGKRKVIKIIRDVVQIGASFAKSSILEYEDLKTKIGYISLPKFYRDFSQTEVNCTQDVKKELIRLKGQNVQGMILDLRNNGGGALPDAKEMSGLFIKDGPIVQVKDHSGTIDVLADDDSSITYNGPLIVLMNRFSASASEILAAALQDYKRAIIVGGEYSHGKGTVQAIVGLSQNHLLAMLGKDKEDLGALKLTINKFYRINGTSTQFKGVTPDIILPDVYGHLDSREQDLDFSLPWDKIAKQKYTLWNGASKYDLKTLLKRSQKRVEKNSRIQKIKESVDFLLTKKNDTKFSLNLDEQRKKDLENEKILKKLKNDEKSEKLKVSFFEPSLREHKKIDQSDEKQWKKDFEQEKEEWVTSLKKDPILEEGLFIVHDMIQMESGKKLSVAKK